LVSHAFGAGNIKQCGVILNRGRLVALAAFIPIALILCKCGDFLEAIGMNPIASQHASLYTQYLIPAMLFHSQFDATRQYLNALD
jgi:Na+-driven multidrug efflux pump